MILCAPKNDWNMSEINGRNWWGMTGQGTTSGIRVTETSALTFSAFFAGVRIISETLATTPCNMLKQVDYRTTEFATGHPLWPIFHDAPNGEQDIMSFLDSQVALQIAWGNAYSEKQYDSLGNIIALWPIHPSRIPLRNIRRNGMMPSDYGNIVAGEPGEIIFYVSNDDGSVTPIPASDMFHVPGVMSSNFITGQSIVKWAANSLGLALAMETHASAVFRNGALSNLVLKHPKTISPEAAVRLRTQWQSVFAGVQNHYKTLILEDGMDVLPINMNPADSQLILQRQFAVNEIARWLRLPPHMLAEMSRCMPGSTLVYTESGPKKIVDITFGERVWSVSDNGIQLSNVVNCYDNGIRPLMEFRTTNRTVKCTENHRLLVRRPHDRPLAKGEIGGKNVAGSKVRVEWSNEYIFARDIRVGDTLVTLERLPDAGVDVAPNGRQLTVGFMEFCGLLLGDGNVLDGGVTIARGDATTYMEYYRQVIKAEFTQGGWVPCAGEKHGMSKLTDATVAMARARVGSGESCRSIAAELSVCCSTVEKIVAGTSWNAAKRTDIKSIHFTEGQRRTQFRSMSAAVELRSLGFSGTAFTKRVPDWVFETSDEMRLSFLRGFLDADGTVDKKGRISFFSANRFMLDQMRHLCMGLGIPVTNSRFDVNKHPAPGSDILVPTVMWRFTCSDPGANRRIGSHDTRYQERFAAGKPFGKKDRKYPKFGVNSGVDGLSLARVVSISELPPEPTFDIEVEGTHSFIADGVVSHNSTNNNIEFQGLEFLVYSMMPWLVRWEKAMNRQLLTIKEKKTHHFKFDITGLLRGDQAARSTYFQILFNIGALSPNDIRQREDLNPIDGGDQYFIQGNNAVPLDKIGELVQSTIDKNKQPPAPKALPAPAGSSANEPTPHNQHLIDLKAAMEVLVEHATSRPDQVQELITGITKSVGTVVKEVGDDLGEQITANRMGMESGLDERREKAVAEIKDAVRCSSDVHLSELTYSINTRVTEEAERKTMLAEVATDAARQAVKLGIQAEIEQLMRYEVRAARAAAKKPSVFLSWRDEFYPEFSAKLAAALDIFTDAAEKLGVPLESVAEAETYVLESIAGMETLAALKCGELEAGVESLIETWAKRPQQLAESLFRSVV